MTKDEITSIIEAAADRHGVPADALLAIAGIESDGSVYAKNPSSSASGLFQFVDATAREYGLTGAKRNDPVAQADAAARMAATNSRALERVLGQKPTAGHLYLAHQQGLGGATALIRGGNGNVIDVMTGVYGSRSKAEAAVRLNGGNSSMSASQFADKWIVKANNRTALIPPAAIGNGNAVGTQLSVTPRKAITLPTPLSRNPANPPLPRPRQETSVSRSISGFPTPLPRNPANPPLPVKRPSQAVTTLPPAKLPSLPPGGPVTSQTRQGQRADNNQTKPLVLTRQTAAMTQAQAQAATGFRLPAPPTGNTMTRKQQLADNGQTRPKTVTKQVQVPNPAYQALMQQAAAGAKVGVTPSGMPLSRDGFARYEASKKAIEAKLAATPKTITVTRTVRQPVPVKPLAKAAPVVRPAPRPSPPPINLANHNSAQLKAVAEGRSTYSVAGAPSRSVYAMNGKLRNTYGDDPRTSTGGSLIG